MSDFRQFTDALRELADVIDAANAKEPSLAFVMGATMSLTVPAARVAHAAAALGAGEPWETLMLGPGFLRNVGPHQLMLFLSHHDAPDPLADPTFVSPVRVLHPAPRDAA